MGDREVWIEDDHKDSRDEVKSRSSVFFFYKVWYFLYFHSGLPPPPLFLPGPMRYIVYANLGIFSDPWVSENLQLQK